MAHMLCSCGLTSVRRVWRVPTHTRMVCVRVCVRVCVCVRVRARAVRRSV
jgi:hypothetical protein